MPRSNGKPLPVWRCQHCQWWTSRNGETSMACRFCQTKLSGGKGGLITPLPMWPAFRVEPEPVKANTFDDL